MLSKLKIILLLITFTFIWSCGDKAKKISEIVEVDMEKQMSNAYKEGYLELKKMGLAKGGSLDNAIVIKNNTSFHYLYLYLVLWR